MDRLEQVKYCVFQLYSDQKQENFKQVHKFLIDWGGSDTVAQDCIQLLATESDTTILFHAANTLCNFLKFTRLTRVIEKEQIIEIGNFVSELVLQYISSGSGQNYGVPEDSAKSWNENSLLDNNFFRIFLICIADSCAFSEGAFLLRDACGQFPIDISLRICQFFFEDWNKHINTKFDVKADDIEFTLTILREFPVSDEWISLYNAFSEYKPKIDILSEFFPQLHELLDLTETYNKLIDHIELISVLSFNSYTMIIFQLSLEFSKHLRDLICSCLEKNDIDLLDEYTEQLTYLWSIIIAYNDEDESILREDVSPLFLDLLKEFTIAESVLMDVVQKTENIDLWPKLIESMEIFGKSYNGKEPYQHYATNILEFILFAGTIGVDLSEEQIKENLFEFYTSNAEEINQYLANPTQNVPSILTFLSIIARTIMKMKNEQIINEEEETEDDILPIEIPLMYLENIDIFQSSPKDVVYFSLTFIDAFYEDDKCTEKFCQIFCCNFEMLPYDCAEGLYKISNLNRKVYFEMEIPQLLYENYEKVSFFDESSNDQEQSSNWDGELFLSKSPLIFMLPCIITDQIDIIINDPQYADDDKENNEEMTEVLTTQLNGIASHIFDNLIEVIESYESRKFNLFLSVISSVFYHIKSEYEIAKRFCSLIFQQIMQSSQHLWLSQSNYLQNSLAYFVESAFENDFVGESAPAVASWLDHIVSIAPVERHFKIPRYLVPFFKDMTNLCMVIHNCIIFPDESDLQSGIPFINPEYIDFATVCLESLLYDEKPWDDSYFFLYPPQLLLTLATLTEYSFIRLVFIALNRILDSEKADGEFIEQLLLITLTEYGKNRMSSINLDMIAKIYQIIGGELVIQACNGLEMGELEIKELVDDIIKRTGADE